MHNTGSVLMIGQIDIDDRLGGICNSSADKDQFLARLEKARQRQLDEEAELCDDATSHSTATTSALSSSSSACRSAAHQSPVYQLR